MKTTLTILAMIMIAAIGTTGYAQTSKDASVKILPTASAGIIKVHYALPVSEPLQITFFDEQHDVIGKDKIAGVAAPNGISKRYDVNKITTNNFWVEISAGKQLFVYHITRNKDRNRFTAVMEPAPDQLIVKGNN